MFFFKKKKKRGLIGSPPHNPVVSYSTACYTMIWSDIWKSPCALCDFEMST